MSVWFLLPLFPVFVIFFIGSVAETNRAPFDLAEAESELVSGFMTEHAAVIFVFFFLAEYASILLICILNSMLFLGGYIINFDFFVSAISYIISGLSSILMVDVSTIVFSIESISFASSPLVEGIIYGLIIGVKASFMVFVFI
jgi:NADH-ubiquinone oxidoreductase chain 1